MMLFLVVVQVIGSWGFIISATMFCLEVQKHWWLPRPLNLGWQARLAHFVSLTLSTPTDANSLVCNGADWLLEHRRSFRLRV